MLEKYIKLSNCLPVVPSSQSIALDRDSAENIRENMRYDSGLHKYGNYDLFLYVIGIHTNAIVAFVACLLTYIKLSSVRQITWFEQGNMSRLVELTL